MFPISATLFYCQIKSGKVSNKILERKRKLSNIRRKLRAIELDFFRENTIRYFMNRLSRKLTEKN